MRNGRFREGGRGGGGVGGAREGGGVGLGLLGADARGAKGWLQRCHCFLPSGWPKLSRAGCNNFFFFFFFFFFVFGKKILKLFLSIFFF